jgi:hypothetical protein
VSQHVPVLRLLLPHRLHIHANLNESRHEQQ